MARSLRFQHGSRVMLLNPPIADTIEADTGGILTCVEPAGLLRLGTFFRRAGCRVELIDCLRDPTLDGRLRRHVRKVLSCGNETEEEVHKEIWHFGLDRAGLEARLRAAEPPDLIAVSTDFTWYAEPTAEAITVCKQLFPRARIVLGGNLATLCPEAAARSGADEVFAGDVEGVQFLPTALDLMTPPHEVASLRLTKGCPYHCSYCATPLLNDSRVLSREPADALEEIRAKRDEFGVTTFNLFDDFVLYRRTRCVEPFLDAVAESKLGVEIDFSVGLSSHMLDDTLLQRMRRGGARRVRIALETTSATRSLTMGRPQQLEDFVRAVELLRRHGYHGENVRAFYLIGLPDQTTDEILGSILFLYGLGVTPHLTTYTLIPGTRDAARYADRVRGRALDELAPRLWRFAHPAMKVRELDALHRLFSERTRTLAEVAGMRPDDPVVARAQALLGSRSFPMA